MNLLQVDSSILGQQSVTRELSSLIVKRLTRDGRHQVVRRDLVAEDLPHLTLFTVPSAHPLSGAMPQLGEAQQAQRANSDAILREFLEADAVVIGVPMYNFGIPSELKAWIDRIIIPGTTFRRGTAGPEGLAGGKRVILALARGGSYGDQAANASAEHAESFLRVAFGFIGVKDVEVVIAEGLNIDDHAKRQAIASAREAVGQLAA